MLIGKCNNCKRKESMFFIDNTIQAKGSVNFFKQKTEENALQQVGIWSQISPQIWREL